MAAPITSYSNNKLPISGSTTTTLPLALNLSSYPNLKDTFYLDKIFRVEDDFIGMVKSGSTNYSYHNPNRFSKLRAKDESTGEVYLICNDGGLNTKGHSAVKEVVDSMFLNYIRKINYKSSYYSQTTHYGYIYRVRDEVTTTWGVWSTDITLGSLPERYDDNINVNIGIPPPIDHLTLVQIIPFVINEEGRKEGEIETLYPSLKPILLQQDIWTNSPTTYYINNDEILLGNQNNFTGLWQYSNMTNKYTTSLQLWVDDRFYYTYGYNVPEDRWCFLTYVDTYVPEPIYTTYDFNYYSSDINTTPQAISIIVESGSPVGYAGTLYGKDDIWYTTDQLINIVSDGWYLVGNMVVGITQAIKVISGSTVEEWHI